jgi:hypothetical protein
VLECIDGVLIVGGDEHDLGLRADVGRRDRDIQAAQTGHADIEEGDVGTMLGQRFKRDRAVLAFGDDAQVRPCTAQRFDQGLAQ